jgi:lysophospholipase L1-like esterase
MSRAPAARDRGRRREMSDGSDPEGEASGAETDVGEPSSGAIRYVALGDSYTIGTATRTADERWPNQLVAALRAGDTSVGRLELVANLGVNGFTSRDVIDVELPQLETLSPEFLSLLIGVNDVVQGVPAATYRRNVGSILDSLVTRLRPERIVTVATPDYTVTPEGASFGDPAVQSERIREYNGILAAASGDRGVAWVDIHDLSLDALGDRSLVADDGLHPSGEQYRRWVVRIAPVVAALLR